MEYSPSEKSQTNTKNISKQTSTIVPLNKNLIPTNQDTIKNIINKENESKELNSNLGIFLIIRKNLKF